MLRSEEHLLTMSLFTRRFSGDESFLNDPNDFNDAINNASPTKVGGSRL